MKRLFLSILFATGLLLSQAQVKNAGNFTPASGDKPMRAAAEGVHVVVEGDVVVGKIKPMNGVNNGPAAPAVWDAGMHRDNVAAYSAAKFPFARTHDSGFSEKYGSEHTVDITAIFPDFSKNPNDPKSYDFAITDWYLNRIRESGTDIYFRLGQKIQHHVRKYGVYPPEDFKKWAVICEHIIRHYNEGWADGFEWNIRYWEIWNEPDLDLHNWETSPWCWGGSPEDYYRLYTITAKHLKKHFPNIKIGGPASSGKEDWCENFLKYIQREKAPMDFFSWHIYSVEPSEIAAKAERMYALVERYGYGDAETHLNEWNYIKGWHGEYEHSMQTMINCKGAAFVAAAMQSCQNTPLYAMMYYDARPETEFNGLFDMRDFRPTKTYYSMYAWRRLTDYGTQVRAQSLEKDIFVTAAKSDEGRLRVLVTRYNDDNNVVTAKFVKVDLGKDYSGEIIAHLVDAARTYTEIPLMANNGIVEVKMEPNSLVMIEHP